MRDKARMLAISLLLASLSCVLAQAQSKVNYCEPPADVKEEIKKTLAPVTSDEDLLYKQRQERVTAILQELLKKHPDDFSLRRRVLNDRRYASNADMDALTAEYQAQAEKSPADPAAAYFYSQLLGGGKTKG